MIELLVLGGIALVGVLALAAADPRSSAWVQAQDRTWLDAAQACGLTLDPDRGSFRPGDTLVARAGSLTIRIRPRREHDLEAARVTVDGLPETLRLSSDALRAKVAAIVDTGAVVLGDPEFDAAIVVEGPLLTVRAAFDAPTRRLALDLIRTTRGVSAPAVKNGLLQVHYPDDAVPRAIEPRRFLRQVLDLADRLSGAQVEERLAAIVRADPVAAVRRSALELLRDERPTDAATRRALEDGCADADPLVRLTASLALGPEGARASLVGLTAAADVPDEVSARALAAVGPHLSADELRATLSASLRARRLTTATTGVELLDRAGASDADALAHLLAGSDRGLALAAARALGRCGTADHVPVLRDAQMGSLSFGDLADACRVAVEAIQSRQGPNAPGRLSLAPGGGELGLAENSAGALGLAPDRAATMGSTEPD